MFGKLLGLVTCVALIFFAAYALGVRGYSVIGATFALGALMLAINAAVREEMKLEIPAETHAGTEILLTLGFALLVGAAWPAVPIILTFGAATPDDHSGPSRPQGPSAERRRSGEA